MRGCHTPARSRDSTQKARHSDVDLRGISGSPLSFPPRRLCVERMDARPLVTAKAAEAAVSAIAGGRIDTQTSMRAAAGPSAIALRLSSRNSIPRCPCFSFALSSVVGRRFSSMTSIQSSENDAQTSSSTPPPELTLDPLGLLPSIDAYYSTKPTLDLLATQPNPHLPPNAAPADTANPCPSPLRFTVHRTSSHCAARASTLVLPHSSTPTPVFMPVGTQGSIKGLTAEQMRATRSSLILGNTYHLGLRPGPDVVAAMGGLHRFIDWQHNMLTDSGGFQMVSLAALAEIGEDGVWFASPVDGKRMLLTPEKSMHIQNLLGADVMMALDDVCSTVQPSHERFVEAQQRTIRWIDRCIAAHTRPHQQALFGIVQGGVDPVLRANCLQSMMERDAWLPGYAIGGLAGGESKDAFWRVILQSCRALPPHKPRYAMGVGYPLDLMVCVALGVDMFDCVWPCRTARFGVAIVESGLLNLKRQHYATDHTPIDANCRCPTCQHYTRAMLTPLASRTQLGCHLLTLHNMHYMQQHMLDMRRAILEDRFEGWVQAYLRRMFPAGDGSVWRWVKEAMAEVGLKVGQWGVSGPGAEMKKGAKEEQHGEGGDADDGQVQLVKEVMEEDKLVQGESSGTGGKQSQPKKRKRELHKPTEASSTEQKDGTYR